VDVNGMKKANILSITVFLVFTMIYFTASIVLLGSQYRPLAIELIFTRYILVLLGFLVLIFIYLWKNGLTIIRFPSYLSIYLFIIWILFSLSVILSEILHHSMPIQGLFFLVIVPFIYFTVMPFMTKIGGYHIHYSLFLANFSYLVISYLTVPINFLPYSGVTANPNGFGQISAIVVITGYFILLSLPKKQLIAKVVIFTAMSLAIVGIFLSTSRTSFLVVGIITFILTIHYLLQRNLKPLLILLLAGLIGWFTPIKEMYLTGILDKFKEFYHAGNLSNGRMEIWQEVFSDAALFGNGEDYFHSFFEGAHNSIIYILGVYGIVPAIFLSIFLLFLMILGIQHTIQKINQKFAIFPFIIIFTFILFSMTEAMFGLIGNGITIAFYHVVGILLFHKNEQMEAVAKTIPSYRKFTPLTQKQEPI
jgi:O-antigen ligase